MFNIIFQSTCKTLSNTYCWFCFSIWHTMRVSLWWTLQLAINTFWCESVLHSFCKCKNRWLLVWFNDQPWISQKLHIPQQCCFWIKMFSPFARNQVGKNTFCETVTHHEYWHFASANWIRRNFPGCSKKSIVEWNDGSRRIIRLVWNFLMVKRFSSTSDAMCTPTPERNMTNIVRSYHLRGRLWRRWQSSSCKTFVFGSLFWLLLSISFTCH